MAYLADSDSRIDMKDWENALKLFGPTNALKFNSNLGELKFREEIVEAICQLVPPETKLEDFHVQGRSRLCKVSIQINLGGCLFHVATSIQWRQFFQRFIHLSRTL